MKIIVTAGGTMGHINPALSIIEEFKKQDNKVEVLYIGTTNRMEKDIIPKKNIAYHGIEVYGFTKDLVKDIKNISLLSKAIKECKEIIREFNPDIVIGVGGYVTYPVIKAAYLEKKKIFIHEQNSLPGKTNKLLARYADIIGVTFKSSMNVFKTKGKVIYTGNPCGAKALEIAKKDKETLGFTKGKKLVTFVSGSLGSTSLNQKLKSYLKKIAKKNYEVCYITGKYSYDEFIKEDFPKNVKIFSYMEELPGLLKISDLVISRAGSGSLSELLALEVPSIIIPSPNVSNNHQFYNAKSLEDEGCIRLLNEKDLTTDKIEHLIDEMLNDTTKRMKMKGAMHSLEIKNSSKIIYDEIMKLLRV